MKRIDHITATPQGTFTEGVPGVTPATVLTAAWANNVQEELCNLIESRDVTLDGENHDQLIETIKLPPLVQYHVMEAMEFQGCFNQLVISYDDAMLCMDTQDVRRSFWRNQSGTSATLLGRIKMPIGGVIKKVEAIFSNSSGSDQYVGCGMRVRNEDPDNGDDTMITSVSHNITASDGAERSYINVALMHSAYEIQNGDVINLEIGWGSIGSSNVLHFHGIRVKVEECGAGNLT